MLFLFRSGTNVVCSEAMNPYFCTGYSLPTEHEWELAARSGTSSDFWTGEGSNLGGTYTSNVCNSTVTIQDGVGNTPLSDYAWFCENQDDSTYYNMSKPVGLKLPNGYGLYDMHGNLREWTSDWYGCTYPNGGTWCQSGSNRVVRGGYWNDNPIILGNSNRSLNYPTGGSEVGFRLRKLYIEDVDNDGVNNLQDCDDNDSTLGSINDDADCDGLLTSEDCDDNNSTDTNIAGDCDQDGVGSLDDCDDFDSGSTIVSEDSDCNGIPDDCFLTNCDMSVDLGNGIGADFVLIDELDDPLGRYTLNNNFYMMTTEVTQGMFQELMGYDSRDGKDTNYGDGINHPTYYVSWDMAVHFANTLSVSEGEEECYSYTIGSEQVLHVLRRQHHICSAILCNGH